MAANKKIYPYHFKYNQPTLDTSKFNCCGNYIKKFGMREEWYCLKCKSVYALKLVKVTRYLKKEELDYLYEVIKGDNHK